MPEARHNPRVIAIVNQKGGVGKTTTSINLAAAIAELGLKCLVIDIDPQGNASTGLGIAKEKRGLSIYDVLMEESSLEDAIQKTSVPNLDIIPATTDLSSADMELFANEKRIFLLRDAMTLSGARLKDFDFLFIDCPPSLNLLTINAMVASDAVLVPLQSEFYALEGLSQLMMTVREVRSKANPDLRIDGVVLTMADLRNRLSQQVENDVRQTLGELVFKTVIPRNVRLSEAPSYALTILDYDSASKGSAAYRALARELAERHGYTVAKGTS
jgi:chromosome partitioning protein